MPIQIGSAGLDRTGPNTVSTTNYRLPNEIGEEFFQVGIVGILAIAIPVPDRSPASDRSTRLTPVEVGFDKPHRAIHKNTRYASHSFGG